MSKNKKIFVPEPAKILYKNARFKVLYGGRGSGKSTAAADALILKCVAKNTRWLCAREIQSSLKPCVLILSNKS